MARYLLVLFVLAVSLAACSREEAAAPSPVVATPTSAVAPAAPTHTPAPPVTPTPVPSATPHPTATPTSSPTATFDPGPVILPRDVVSPSPTAVVADPLSRRLDGIGYRINAARGLSATGSVDRNFLTRGELATRLSEEFQKDLEDILEMERLYRTLGVLEPGEDLTEILLSLRQEGILGFYETEDQKLYLVGDSEDFGPPDVRTYVHEFVHHLQQVNFDLHSTFDALEGDSDGSDAFRAVVEGDARVSEMVYLFDHMTEEEQAASQPEASRALIEAFMAAPRVIQRRYNYPYVEGARFVIALYSQNGWDAVDQLYEDRPQSTEQILHPEKYLERDAPVEVELPDLTEALGEGWNLVRRDTFGEFLLMSYLETDFSPRSAAVAAQGWGGDTYALLSGPEDENLLVLPIVWDAEEEASEFFETFLEFTKTRTGADWELVEGNESSRLITLEKQVLALTLEGLRTVLVFAPDTTVLATVQQALNQSE